jgi:hypothetical protein
MAGGVIKLAVAATLLWSAGACATAAPEAPPETEVAAVAGPAVEVPQAPAVEAAPPVVPAPPAVAAPEEVIVIAPPARTGGDGILSMPDLPRLGDLAPVTGPVQVRAPADVTPAAPPAAPRPFREPTPREIARSIAPAFDPDRDYNRLVQCYGTANFAEALFNVQARRAGAGSPAASAAAQTAGLKAAMQPLVLAASTVHTEAKFRADYGAVGDRLQRNFAAAANPQTVLQGSLATVNACRTDINRWRGGN